MPEVFTKRKRSEVMSRIRRRGNKDTELALAKLLRANRAAWWRRKIKGNQARDALVTRTLRRADWRVLRVWEHELARTNEARLVRRLSAAISID